MRVETGACIWGAGGVNEKLRQFFGIHVVYLGWVRKETRHDMDNGLDHQTAKYYTIALVMMITIYLNSGRS